MWLEGDAWRGKRGGGAEGSGRGGPVARRKEFHFPPMVTGSQGRVASKRITPLPASRVMSSAGRRPSLTASWSPMPSQWPRLTGS